MDYKLLKNVVSASDTAAEYFQPEFPAEGKSQNLVFVFETWVVSPIFVLAFLLKSLGVGNWEY